MRTLGELAMSALCQIRKSGRTTRQSALPSRSDIISRAYQVRKVPKAEVKSAVFDHLVDLRKRRCRHSETERFGSFEIEDQRDFAGCWTGQSSGRPPCFHCMKPSARTFPVVRLAVPTPQICRSLTQA
jgi:hypothetical protein